MNQRFQRLFYLVLVVIVFFGCKDKKQEDLPPKRVEIVQKTPEGSRIERGIDAIPGQEDAIKIEWYPNKETNLAGYSVFRSKGNDKNFVEITRINKIYEAIDTTFVDDSVQVNFKYYYYIKAFGDGGQFGESSDTLYYTLIPKVQLLGVSNLDGVPVFSWNYLDPSSAPDDFVFRLQRKIEQNRYESLEPGIGNIKYSFPEEWSLTELGNYGNLPNGEYSWWIDAFFPNQNMGSESNIMQFYKN